MFLHFFIFSLPITRSLTKTKYTMPPKIFVEITKSINRIRSTLLKPVDSITSRSTNITQIIDISNDTLNNTREKGTLSTIIAIANK